MLSREDRRIQSPRHEKRLHAFFDSFPTFQGPTQTPSFHPLCGIIHQKRESVNDDIAASRTFRPNTSQLLMSHFPSGPLCSSDSRPAPFAKIHSARFLQISACCVLGAFAAPTSTISMTNIFPIHGDVNDNGGAFFYRLLKKPPLTLRQAQDERRARCKEPDL